MCHKLLCCFGHSEPENNRPHSADGVAATSSPKPPAAINGGAQAPSHQNNATINQDHEKQADDQIKKGNNQEKPISSPIQGGKQQIDKQEQQNRQEQDGKKQSKIAKAFSFRQKGNNEEKHKSIEDMQKVPAQDVPPEEQGKNSHHEQDLGSNKLGNSNKEQQQIPPPPKEQVHPPKEYTDQKTKIFFAKGDKEFDAQEKHEDSV